MDMDRDLATSEVVGTQDYKQIFAGDAEIVTEEGIVDTGVLAKYTVVGKITLTGKLVALAPGASDGSEKVYGILTQKVDATTEDIRVGVYTGGFFNDAALVWPVNAALDTLIERQQAVRGTQIRIGTVRL